MKILQLAKYYPPIYGGIELVEKMMTKAHSEHGDKVVIHAFDKSHDLNIGEFGEEIYRLKENIKILNAPFSFRYIFNFKKWILKDPPDIIYVHLPNPFMHEVIRLNRSFLNKNEIKIIAIYHSDIVNKSLFGDIYNYYFSKTVSVYEQIIVSSDKLWNSSPILSQLNSSVKKVIPFCIEEEIVTIPAKKGRKKKLVSIGRFVPYKGFDFLINALKETDYELHIIGNGPKLNELKMLGGKNIFIHTNLKHHEKNKLISEADIMIVASRNRAEAYGMTIVEAFSYGIPVIASNINSGVTFLVQHEKTGLTFDVDNVEDFLQQLNRLANDEILWDKISLECQDFYRNELTFEKFKLRLVST
jgi:rhamnosyl/mannosyltransferase